MKPYLRVGARDGKGVQRMNRQEATKILKALSVYECYPKSASEETKEAIDIAIKALQDDWIPVSEPPKENGDYTVSLEGSVNPYAMFHNDKWYYVAFDCVLKEYREHEVTAWRPLPAPYKESDSE